MKIKIKTKIDRIGETKKISEQLNGKTIKSGCFEGEHAWLAAIHEFGCTIKPKTAKYLTVPCGKKAYGKKAGDFKDLFYFESKKGDKFLALKNGKGEIEPIFALMDSVTIPERAFLRKSFDLCHDEVVNKTNKLLIDVLSGKIDVNKFCDLTGLILSTKIKTNARNLDSPPNAPNTKKAKGSSTALFDTGDMIGGISYRVE